jgi:hypothetical protein
MHRSGTDRSGIRMICEIDATMPTAYGSTFSIFKVPNQKARAATLH